MGGCNWTTDAMESQPKKWASCEWSDNTTSSCFYQNGTFGNCMGGGQQGIWGACKMSTGFWGQCMLNGTMLSNCSWGDQASNAAGQPWHFCFWDTGYSTECMGKDLSNCQSMTIPNSAAENPTGWGMCASSEGTWGFCNKNNWQCFTGDMEMMNSSKQF
jgi:hypothetical protein